jgi:RHS repeat-associated protein
MKQTAFVLIAAVITSVILIAPVLAAEHDQRYIVILKSRSGPAPDVARLGGTITFRQEDQLNVTLPPEALPALRADPLVRYIQALAAAGAPLIGEPEEPTPGAPRRLVPHATAGNQSWSRAYSYDDAGNITNIGSQQFVYDALGRLKEMATSGTETEKYDYDRYGNQTKRTTDGVEYLTDAEATTNRLSTSTGYTYDPAGNVTSGDGYTLSYDALGQAATKTYTAATTYNETYIYTAGEERIGVQTSNSGQTSSWWYWSVRDEAGKVLRQYRSSANDPTQAALWIEDYVYRDGLLVGAERPATLGGRRHFHLDHLGSPRLITSNDGQIVSIHDYLPFGGETTSVWQEGYAGFDREDPMKFTGHERDYAGSFGREDGHAIDYMHARYYSPTAGRFLSVDPDLDVEKAQSQPQMWNRYAYVIDNPMVFTDPTGTTVYLVTYTTGNSDGDDEFKRAAQTRAAEIQHQKGYDSKHDTVIVAGVKTKADFAAAMKHANGMFKQFGKVGEVSLFSHAGWHDGPVFHDVGGKATQFTPSELGRIAVNWSESAHACFFGCNTGVRFDHLFATSQRVPTYGFFGYASFSSNPNHYERIQPTGPVYMMSTAPHQLRAIGATLPWGMRRDDP